MNLFLGLFALALGPLLYFACQRSTISRSTLDGLLFITIAGIVVVHIIPDALGVAGPIAFVFVLLGIAFALLIERSSVSNSQGRYGWVVAVAAIGLAIHAAVDGLALIPGANIHDFRHHNGDDSGRQLEALLSNHLALSVIVHRIAVGAAIWWTLRPLLGKFIATGAIFIIAVVTAAAYWLGSPVIAFMHMSGVALFQAFVAGALLHVIVQVNVRDSKTMTEKERRYQAIGERLGTVAGLILVFLVPHAH